MYAPKTETLQLRNKCPIGCTYCPQTGGLFLLLCRKHCSYDICCLSLLEPRTVPDNISRFQKQQLSLTVAGKLGNVASHVNSPRSCISSGVAVSFLVLSCVVAIAQGSSAPVSAALPANHIKPYRVLLVVEHGSDPYGMVVHAEADRFQPVAALLKAWSVPFDILRLDQQHLDATYLFGRSGEIRY